MIGSASGHGKPRLICSQIPILRTVDGKRGGAIGPSTVDRALKTLTDEKLPSTGTVDSPTVQWYGLQTMLEQSESDVLILLDCCAAASSATASGTGVTELIAACGFETWAPGVGEHSFSRSLIEELKYLSHGPPFSVALLHNKVLSRIKYWKPRYASAFASEQRKTPIYIQLANVSNRRSIELGPMPQQSLCTDSTDASQSQSQSSAQSSESEDIDMLDSGSSQTSLAEVWPDPEFQSPKVLVSFALEDDQTLRVGDWTDWLKAIPALAKFMSVQGVYFDQLLRRSTTCKLEYM